MPFYEIGLCFYDKNLFQWIARSCYNKKIFNSFYTDEHLHLFSFKTPTLWA
uniref:Uncharacterized protein n=1 Tax=viral metagenome TaxID=1070528 RepID=A0A6C0DPR2_9ZZZZ